MPLLATGYVAASTFDVGLLGMCLRLPFLLVGLPAGVWVTRLGLLRSMIGADIARGLAIGLLPALVLAGQARMPLLLAAATVVGMGTVFFQVSYQSLVPELIPDETRWHGANTRLSLSESAALLCGPALGGLVVSSGRHLAPWRSMLVPTPPASLPSCSSPAAVGRTCGHGRASDSGILRAQVRDGLRYVRHSPITERADVDRRGLQPRLGHV